MVNKAVFLNELVGGARTATRVVGSDITLEHVIDTYRRYPGAKLAITKLVQAMYHNGFDSDIPRDRIHQLMKATEYAFWMGWSSVVARQSDKSIEAWSPRAGEGVGFIMVEFDDNGDVVTIEIQKRFDENSENLVKITNDPNGTYKDNYNSDIQLFMMRSPDGLNGVRGESKILPLVDVFRIQYEIVMQYMKYAYSQGINVPVLQIKDLNTDSLAEAKAQMVSTIKKGEVPILDIEDKLAMLSQMAGSWDPYNMIDFCDKYIARVTQMNKNMLTGDPSGHLTSSITAMAAWYDYVREQQDLILPQILPILEYLGYGEAIFNDPAEYTSEQKWQSALLIRQATDGIVSIESQIDLLNKHLGLQGKEKLKPLSKKERKQLMKKKEETQDE